LQQGLQLAAPTLDPMVQNVTAHFVGTGTSSNPNTATISVDLSYIEQFGAPGQVIPHAPIPQAPILVMVTVPNPSNGGAVGRTKIADDNSPLPRDRFILDYDYFDNVPLSRQTGVHRFSPGIEKTFLDQSASIEVRLPFAATLSSDVTTAG